MGAYSVGMFHLFTHAFFKALLFLGSGSVIHAMHHEQDIRKMGGLKDKIPFTYWMMVIGTLALVGFPFTAGYFSKDAIIEAAFVGKNPMAFYAFLCVTVGALLTSFYSWRLILKTFHGRPHDQHHYDAAHESPLTMLLPLAVLAAGSILAGLPFKEIFAGHGVEDFFRELVEVRVRQTPCSKKCITFRCAIAMLPTLMLAIGFAVAWLFYIRRPSLPVELARQHARALSVPAQQVVLRRTLRRHLRAPVKWLGRFLWKHGDGWLIDGFGPDGVSARVLDVTREDVRRPVGISLSLRLFHADRRRRARHLVHVRDGNPLMASWPILSITTFLPLLGALFIALLDGSSESGKRNARWVALWTTLVTLAVSLILLQRFDPSSAEFQFIEKQPWLGGAITYHMGVDGISLPFVILTTALMPFCIVASWQSIQDRVKEYMIAFLVLETLMVGTFSALDLMLFYLFFEGGLIPMFLIIGIWGGPRRVYASFKFFLYTLLGSVLMLLAILAMYWSAGTTDIVDAAASRVSRARCRPGRGWLSSRHLR